jgi:multicomponent Na+:H+ antiporter subunit G
LTEIAICAALLIGTSFIVVSALGLLRLPDVYSRMHAVTKATTLGLAGVLAASALVNYAAGRNVIRELLTMWFVLMTNPVGGYMIARSAYLVGIPLSSRSVIDQLGRAGEKSAADHDIV